MTDEARIEAQLVRNVQAIGRSMRLISMNIDGPGISTELLKHSLESLQNIIGATLLMIPPKSKLMTFDTRLGQNVEDLIATEFGANDVPDTLPESWS